MHSKHKCPFIFQSWNREFPPPPSNLTNTHGMSLPPVTISPSRRVVNTENTGPLCAFTTSLCNVLSFHTYTSPLIAPVYVTLFCKYDIHIQHSHMSPNITPSNLYNSHCHFVTKTGGEHCSPVSIAKNKILEYPENSKILIRAPGVYI